MKNIYAIIVLLSVAGCNFNVSISQYKNTKCIDGELYYVVPVIKPFSEKSFVYEPVYDRYKHVVLCEDEI